MKVAITGGTGFVGRHLADRLVAGGHEVVVIGRGDTATQALLPAGVTIVAADITDATALATAFAGCDAVVHCAGINREIGSQTYASVHVEGTRAVVEASRAAGVKRLVMLSFLRARPDGPTEYHRSKWEAEELVGGSGLSWTILKAGVIYGRGDHMLDHLSHAFYTFPIFGLVGMKEQPVRPVAVADVARVLDAAVTGDARLADRTVAVLGPDEMPLGEAVRRVARVTGRRPLFLRLPIAVHLLISHVAELLMRVPLVSLAQVRILQEGVTVPAPAADSLPPDLAPATPFSAQSIRAGLPSPGGFGRADLRAWRSSESATPRSGPSGHLLYDQDCGLCLATAAWLAKRVTPRRLGLVAIGDAETDPRIARLVRCRSLASTIHFVRSDDVVLTGARAVLAAARLVPRWRWLAIAFDHRVGHVLLEPLYRQVAANRRRIGRALNLPVACPLPPRKPDSADR